MRLGFFAAVVHGMLLGILLLAPRMSVGMDYLMGMTFAAAVVANVVGVILGIAGLVAPDCRRGLAVCGLALNVLPAIVVLAWMVYFFLTFDLSGMR